MKGKLKIAQYLDPIQHASSVPERIKKVEGCDLVNCLLHLGYKYQDNKVRDEILAMESEHIDLILGGHTHTFFDSPVVYKNKTGSDVVVNQAGWAGIVLGRMEFAFQRIKQKKLEAFPTVVIGKKTGE